MSLVAQKLHSRVEKLANLLTARGDVQVIHHADFIMTDGRRIFLPAIPSFIGQPDLTEEQEQVILEYTEALEGFIDHETAHINKTDWNAIRLIESRHAQRWANLMEDARIEKAHAQEWRGSLAHFKKSAEIVIKRELRKPGISQADIYFLTCFVLSRGYMELLPLLPEHEKLKNDLKPLWPALFLAKDTKNTYETSALGVWLAKAVGQEDKDLGSMFKGPLKEALSELEKKFAIKDKTVLEVSMTEVGESKILPSRDIASGDVSHTAKASEALSLEAPEEKEKTPKKEKREEEEKKKEEEEEEEEKEEDKEEEEKLPDFSKLKDDPLMLSALTPSMAEELTEIFKITGDYYCPYSTKEDVIVYAEDGNKTWFAESIRTMKGQVGAMMRQLRMAVKGRAKVITERDKTFGSLNVKAFPRLLLRSDPRVFKQKSIGITTNVRISLLVDQSGSMSGTKIVNARYACMAFGEFCFSMKIPFEVLGFSTVNSSGGRLRYDNASKEEQALYTRWDNLLTWIYKDFDEDWHKVGHRLEHMKAWSENVDGESVLIAAKRLVRTTRRGERAILIVLSDGFPAQPLGHLRDIHKKHLADVIYTLDKSNVTCIGIGVNSKAVENFYPKHVVIQDLQHLTEEPLNQIKQILLGKC